MGCGAAVGLRYSHIPDKFHNPEQVTDELLKCGLRQSQLIIGVDFTQSNHNNGQKSFMGHGLHEVNVKRHKNPYQEAFAMVANTFPDYDADQLYPIYGFGDAQTGNRYVFSFEPYDRPCKGLEAAVERYKEIAKVASLSGPTSFAPIIRQAIMKLREAAIFSIPTFHVLLILADGDISQTDKLETENAIEEASHYPLSIICVGVGDGPWDTMEKYDNKLRRRCFDNFQFVDYNVVFAKYPYITRAEAFTTHALQKLPDQYRACRSLGYLSNDWEMPTKLKVPPKPLGPPDQPNIGDPNDGILTGWTAVHHHTLNKYFYMCLETKETVWDKPVVSLYKPPRKHHHHHEDKHEAHGPNHGLLQKASR